MSTKKAQMWPRAARNFIKNGYFPTDYATLRYISNSISINSNDPKTYMFFDLMCGEGSALLELTQSLAMSDESTIVTYGIEIDQERAATASQWLDIVVHSDIENIDLKARQASFLLYNPPYGQLATDHESGADLTGLKGSKRLEKKFWHRAVRSVCAGGVVAAILPVSCLDQAFISMIASELKNVTIKKAGVSDFKQVVILGIRKAAVSQSRTSEEVIETYVRDQYDNDECCTVEDRSVNEYTIPAAKVLLRPEWQIKALSSEVLAAAKLTSKGNWPTFSAVFQQQNRKSRLPLQQLRPWHTALALAAGLLNGQVQSSDGLKRYIIKGRTFKQKDQRSETEFDKDGQPRTVVYKRDIFTPEIIAIDISNSSITKGQITEIQ